MEDNKRTTSAFQFIRSKIRSSYKRELKRQRSKDDADLNTSTTSSNILTKWLKELKPGCRSTLTSMNQSPKVSTLPSLFRSNTSYHSEGKGPHKHKPKDYRRHSFNDRQITPLPTRKRTRTNGSDVTIKPLLPAKDVISAHTMMPSRSTPNLQAARENKNHPSSIYSYLQNQSGLSFAPVITTAPTRDDDSPPPAPPVRDSSSLRSIKYGPGHEKFPSWPVPAAAEAPQALRGPPSGGSHRSKSWTDHTNYPKEKVVTYTRPYMKRQLSSHTQQKLKTVLEKCEKITSSDAYDSDKYKDRLYFPRVDREGKILGDMDYVVPSPPERDTNKMQLTQPDLEEYARSYQDPSIEKYAQYGQQGSLSHLTQAELEEYTRNYEEALIHQHQKQPSYAQSEGYHSYVSSTDSTSTPFLDRLRRDSEVVATRTQPSWDDLSEQENHSTRREGRDSVVTTSSGSASSSETLKWHGSMSDVSVASSSCMHLANSSSSVSKQLIAHSARVQTPQRHHSESVLYIGTDNLEGWKDRENKNNITNKLKLFPVNTYTVQPSEQQQEHNERLSSLSSQTCISVQDRVNELEKQQKYSYLDPDKRHRIPDPTLKAIQKKALLSFYERHQTSSNKSLWKSEPQLAHSQPALVPIPQPPPRIKAQSPSRRASSASDYASGNNSRRSSLSSTREKNEKLTPRHHHSNSCGSLSTDLLGPVIVGPSISIDDFIPEQPPERPPKNPNLRNTFPDLFRDQRVPSPDLPPPSPPTVLEEEVVCNDEPLPPPPPELSAVDWQHTTSNQFAVPQVQTTVERKLESLKSFNDVQIDASAIQTVGLPENNSSRFTNIRSSIRKMPHEKSRAEQYKQIEAQAVNKLVAELKKTKQNQAFGFPSQRNYAERSSARYPTNHKLVLSNVAVSQKVMNGGDQFRVEPMRAHIFQTAKIDDIKKPPAVLPVDTRSNKRASIAEGPYRDVPPPLQPRQMRINQSMRAKFPENRPELLTSPSDDKMISRSRPLNYTMSHSKASYLASRRERERVVPNSDIGVYKRTMSPNGHAIHPDTTIESLKPTPQEWSNRQIKEAPFVKNNPSIMRRASMNEKSNSECDKDLKKHQIVLPDVLPVKEKMLPPRPKHLVEMNDINSSLSRSPNGTPPSSPTKSPSRNSPFMPLKSTALSSAPLRTSSNSSSSPKSPIRISPLTNFTPMYNNTESLFTNYTHNSQHFELAPCRPKPQEVGLPLMSQRKSPLQLPSPISSETSSPLSLSPKRTSPMISTATNTSFRRSPPESPPPPRPTAEAIKEDSEQPKVIEGLKMIQRTEVVLRVNACTIDASSQTEKEELPPTPIPARKKLQEEIECEKLSHDLVKQLSPSDRLKNILVPGPEHKKSTDYVTGLFRLDVTLKPRPANSPFRSRTNTPSSSPPPTNNSSNVTKKNEIQLSTTVPTLEPISPLSGTSTYFTTSEPKAKFLTRYSQNMNQCNIVKDTKDLNQQKTELVSRLDRKLEVLRGEQLVVSEECKLNDELGENVEAHINSVARPHEAAKFRLHIEEVGKITSLLLGLSGRLARAENALMGMSEDHPEMRILESKKDKLKEQLEEAKKLKESIDRRSISVSNILYKYLNSEEYADYDHFINMKAKLIMDSREIADKIKLGEEQLMALKATLTITD